MSGAITAGTIAAVAGISAAGSVASGIIGSNAAGNAASAQEQAANNAAQLQYQASQNALDFQKQQYNTNQANAQPWLQSGTGAVSQLDYLLGVRPQSANGATAPNPSATPQSSPNGLIQGGNPVNGVRSTQVAAPGTVPGTPGSGISAPTPAAPFSATAPPSTTGGFGSLMTPYSGKFTAPTALTEQNDPGYQARLQLGTQALQQSAAARGNVVTGGTANDLNQYAQNYASNEYGNVYNRALQTYDQGYNQYTQGQAQQFNQLAALSGVGQQTAQQLGTAGQAASNNVTNNLNSTASNMGQDYQNAGAANASGYVGGANAINGAISGGTNNLSNMLMIQQMMGNQSGGTPTNQNELTGAGF